MALAEELLSHLWTQRINAYTNEDWIDKEIEMSQRYPNGPFADTGPTVARLLELGATRRELSLLMRTGEYNGIFDVLYALDRVPEVIPEVVGISLELLQFDPSGLEGRPGSAPARDGTFTQS